ncbi:MAG TPA: lytic transglycosylase domain-containing protein [Candidatus Polarisedimenticolaceae bacterium]
MKWITRPFATLTVLLAVVAATFFAGPSSEPMAAAPVRQQTLALAGGLPDSWEHRAIAWLDAQRGIPMSRTELGSLVRLVDRTAERFETDPLMILAVIQVESRFDPFAVSPRGARGLMQVRPETAREIAPRLGIEWTSDDLLFDPEVNVLIGTWYVQHLLERFDGNLDAAFAAYEAGPGRIEGHLARSSEVPLRYADRIWNVLVALQTQIAA